MSLWVTIAILLPVAIPVLFYYVVSLFVTMERMGLGDLIYSLFAVNGVYVFLGMTLLLDLFYDYRHEEVRKLFTPVFYLCAMPIFLFSLGLFICMLHCVPNGTPLVENTNFVYATAGSAIVMAGVMKLKIIICKNKF